MNSRTILFILASTAIMMVAMTLQSAYGPKPPTDQPVGDTSSAAASIEAIQADEEGTEVDDADVDSDTERTEPQTKSSKESPAEATDDEAGATSLSAADADSTENPTADAEAAAGDQITTQSAEKFLTLGSVSPDGKDRFLIMINPMGGTIRRVELNYRREKDERIVYRELSDKSGYLGHLEPIQSGDGLKVRVVGPGTPAALATSKFRDAAGVRVDDILQSLDGEPITSKADLLAMLAKTRPGDSVQLAVKRDGKTVVQNIELTEQPIELIRPEITRVSEGFDLPESFVISAIKPRPELDKPWPDLDRQLRDGLWDVDVARTNDRQIALTRTISSATLANFDMSGPIVLTKIYSLTTVPEDQIHDLDSKTFHFNLTVEIRNKSDEAQTLAYELDGPAGATTETWWYAMKIHGRSSAIGYIAGARDVVGGNEENPFLFYSASEIVDGSEDDPPEVNFICDPYEESPEARQLLFAGVDTQYFNISLIPETSEDQPFEVNSLSAYLNGRVEIPENARLKKLVDCTFQMVKKIELAPGGTYSHTFEVFAGPKEQDLLSAYGLGEVETFGWFAWFSKPLLWLLHFFYFITFKFSYGIAIIMLTVLVRCLMIPFSRKAALNAQMMQHLQPQMMEIKERHKEDMQMQSQAQRELFSKYNYNPLSGCLPMFFQLPIFIGLYRGLVGGHCPSRQTFDPWHVVVQRSFGT